jgi:hypothetical protein
MNLLAAEGAPSLKVVVDEREPLEFPIRARTIAAPDSAVEADPVELLLAEFGRRVASDNRVAAVLSAMTQV